MKTCPTEEELSALYDKWFNTFGSGRDALLRLTALCRVLSKKNLIAESEYQSEWFLLMENDLDAVGQYLQQKTESEESKPPLHSRIFQRFIRFIFR